ncbi:MAG TPA: carbohydrate porin [Candidatus Solibacter sp.]|nr:carbohydrate porin [Candidatus Solibacter sp.]
MDSTPRRLLIPLLFLTPLVAPLTAQDQRWSVRAQATSIGQYHPGFDAQYNGPFSLANHPEAEVSLTTTLFIGLRLSRNTYLYIDPEIAGGRGFSAVNGIANFPNGEMPRVATATPKPYLARLYFTHDFAIGDARETTEGDEHQLAGSRPTRRYSVTAGRFTLTDFFDNNRYSHDPRSQFMGWAVMYNGAWDYPADTRGYTWGWVHELHMKQWSLRYGSAAEPRVANGLRFDRRLLRDRGDVIEGEVRIAPNGHAGAIRALTYFNHTDSGHYAAALALPQPDITAVHRPGTLKYGFGLNVEQEISKYVGVFGRLGWNDGKTQSFAYAIIDRLAGVGISVDGAAWKRKHDTLGTAFTATAISGVHGLYLARGGTDFMIGDGALSRGREFAWETYYSAELFKGFFAALDLQSIANPAYNRDRGPVWVGSLRLHAEWGR